MGNCCNAAGGEIVRDINVDSLPVLIAEPDIQATVREAAAQEPQTDPILSCCRKESATVISDFCDREEPGQKVKSDVQPASETLTNKVTIVFDAGGIEQSIDVKFSPLGLKFRRKLPIVVKGFQEDSYGKTLGIKPDW
eukprot:CAMPEP_0169144726 /NCGR_PEP_ID=MMETSP1015-20121227/46458_1 /TAXON_ID=342587 /ORGANISM="Karlodinium micrum, Strain CCMP2283" /LENGTH=137 /DNA_ID=CAMNT_0009212121 /DNA_START=26 /DNA_END=436 /DNA_ORIENTATION=-